MKCNIQLFFLYAIVAYESPHTLEPHKSFCFRVKRGNPLPVSLSLFLLFLSLPPLSIFFPCPSLLVRMARESCVCGWGDLRKVAWGKGNYIDNSNKYMFLSIRGMEKVCYNSMMCIN